MSSLFEYIFFQVIGHCNQVRGQVFVSKITYGFDPARVPPDDHVFTPSESPYALMVEPANHVQFDDSTLISAQVQFWIGRVANN